MFEHAFQGLGLRGFDNRIEQDVPGCGDAAANGHHVRAEEGDDVRNGNAQVARHVGNGLQRQGVTRVGGRADCLGRKVAAGQAGCLSFVQPVSHVADHRRPGSDRLQASLLPTAAKRAVWHHAHVADLSRRVRRAVVNPAVEDDAAADAGAQGEEDEGVAPAAGAHAGLGQGCHVGVVVQFDADAQTLRQESLERNVMPVQVGRENDEAFGGGDTGDAYAHACEVVPREALAGQETVDLVGNPVRHTFRPGCGLGGPTVLNVDFPCGGHKGGLDKGSAQIDPDRVW